MDFDFSDLRKGIANIDAAYAKAGADSGSLMLVDIFARPFAQKIGATLKPYLVQVTPDISPTLKEEMNFLYSKMISYAPVLSLFHFVKGQFHSKCGEFDHAVSCLQTAYDIECDPTRKTWPHLQSTESSARLLVTLGDNLYKAGRKEEGTRFFNAGAQMMEKVKPALPPENPPEPQ